MDCKDAALTCKRLLKTIILVKGLETLTNKWSVLTSPSPVRTAQSQNLMFINITNGSLDGMQIDVIR